MELYSRDKTRRSLIDTVAFRVLSQITTMAGYVVMVRGMTREDFGVFNLLYSFIPVVSTVASLGLEQVLRRYQPEYLKAGNIPAALWLVRFVASARFGTNVVVVVLVLLLWNHAAPLFKLEPYRIQFALFSGLILLHFQARILQLSLAAHMLHRYSVGSMAVLAFVKLVVYGGFVWFDALTLEKAIVADTIAYAVTFLSLRVVYQRICLRDPEIKPIKPDAAERNRLLRYGVYNNFNDAGTLMLNTKSDNFFIAAFMDPLSVGIYAFYTRLNEMANSLLPVRLFENVVQPLMFSISASESTKKLSQYFSLLINLNLVIQWPILAFCVSYHAELVDFFFDGKFVEESWLLPIVVAFASINVMALPVTIVAQYKEKSSTILFSKIFAIYNVAALLVLVPRLGLYGAALASGSAQALKNLFIWWFVRSFAVWANARIVLLSGIVCWGSAVAVCFGLKYLVPASPPLQLLVGCIVCGVTGLLYVRSPGFSADDRNILGAVLKGKEARLLQIIGLLKSPRISRG